MEFMINYVKVALRKAENVMKRFENVQLKKS